MRRFARSLAYGLLAQALAVGLVFLTRSEALARWLLWNVSLAARLARPMPLVGRTLDGRPVSEPATIHFVMGLVGLAFGVAVYSALVDVALGAFGAGGRREGAPPGPGKAP